MHVAIIPDGNGRWAVANQVAPSVARQAAGCALHRVVEGALEHDIQMLTIYAFSTENWTRSRSEVDGLLHVIDETLSCVGAGVRVRMLGRPVELADYPRLGRERQWLPNEDTRLQLNVCLNYGGRAELVDAVREIVAAGHGPQEITEDLISSHLYTRELPEPDLVIRTAGEMRLSNFLLWQTAYSEFFITTTLWPDFGRDDLLAALAHYRRCRRLIGRHPPSASECTGVVAGKK